MTDTPTLTRNTELLRVEVAAHIKADALRRGTYWDGRHGCFIGCLTHSNDPKPAFERFGLPEAVLRIAENIFEALPDDEGKAFFAALPEAVGCDGKDLSRVHWAFLAAELRALPVVSATIQAVIDPVIDGMNLLAQGGNWPDAAARAAFAAARAAAAYAADAAAYAADAARAAAAVAAAYAADAVAAAAYAAADAAARIRQRNTLLRLIAEAPITASAA